MTSIPGPGCDGTSTWTFDGVYVVFTPPTSCLESNYTLNPKGIDSKTTDIAWPTETTASEDTIRLAFRLAFRTSFTQRQYVKERLPRIQ